MNFKQLRAFLALAERGSVTATAEHLNVTQSGVSRQIATLEDELGFSLFDRTKGRLVINRRGHAFLRHVRQTVDLVDHLPRAARAIADGVFDRVNVVATSSIIHGLLPGAIARYVAKRPGMPPRVIMRSLREIAELGPEIDFDLMVVPMPFPLSRFRLVETIEFELHLAGPSALIPSSDGPIDIGQLGDLPFISLDPFATYQESIETILGAAGLNVSYVCETSSVVMAAQLVRLGVGCAFLDPFIAGAIQGPGIRIVRLRQRLTHAYGVYAPASGFQSQEAQQFLEMMREHSGATTELGH